MVRAGEALGEPRRGAGASLHASGPGAPPPAESLPRGKARVFAVCTLHCLPPGDPQTNRKHARAHACRACAEEDDVEERRGQDDEMMMRRRCAAQPRPRRHRRRGGRANGEEADAAQEEEEEDARSGRQPCSRTRAGLVVPRGRATCVPRARGV
eukprot:scaffold6246_cov215-Prasinococcus_capsulatus_cf.AAC.1